MPATIRFVALRCGRKPRPFKTRAKSATCALSHKDTLFSRRGIDNRRDLGNLVGRKSTLPCVFANHLFIGGAVNAVDLVVRHITLDPLNLRSQVPEHSTRFLRNGVELVFRKLSRARQFAFYYVLGHRSS